MLQAPTGGATLGLTDIAALTITPAPPPTTLTVMPAAGTYGATANFSATLTAAGVAAGGRAGHVHGHRRRPDHHARHGNDRPQWRRLSEWREPRLAAGGNLPGAVSASFGGDASGSTSTGSGDLSIAQATPTVTWAMPANITQGQALGAAQLDAPASVPGTFAYSPPAGKVLPAGMGQTLTAVFTPADATDYKGVNVSTTINVLPTSSKTPTTLAVMPIVGTYGTPTTFAATLTAAGTPLAGEPVTFTVTASGQTTTLGTAMTNASGVASLSGVSLGSLSAGTYPGAVSASFSGDASDAASTGSGDLSIARGTPTVTWAVPTDITQGQALGAAQLDATASVPGSFAYSPPAGTVLPAGMDQTLTVVFTPTDTTDYKSVDGNTTLGVLPKSATLTVMPVAGTYGTTASFAATLTAAGSPLGGEPVTFTITVGGQTTTLGTATTDASGVASLSGVSLTIVSAGVYPGAVIAAFGGDSGIVSSANLSIAQATPKVTWAVPADITQGQALGAAARCHRVGAGHLRLFAARRDGPTRGHGPDPDGGVHPRRHDRLQDRERQHDAHCPQISAVLERDTYVDSGDQGSHWHRPQGQEGDGGRAPVQRSPQSRDGSERRGLFPPGRDDQEEGPYLQQVRAAGLGHLRSLGENGDRCYPRASGKLPKYEQLTIRSGLLTDSLGRPIDEGHTVVVTVGRSGQVVSQAAVSTAQAPSAAMVDALFAGSRDSSLGIPWSGWGRISGGG